MTDEVWEVISIVRDYHEECESVPEHRVLLQDLCKRHGKEKATRKNLYNMNGAYLRHNKDYLVIARHETI